MTEIIIPIIIYNHTRDTSLLVASYSFQMVPVILLGTLFNQVISRLDKLLVYVLTDVLQALVLILIWVYIGSESFSVIFLVFLLILASVFSTINGIVSDYFILPLLVEKDKLFYLNSLFSQIISYAGFVAPVILSLISAITPEKNALLFDAGSVIPVSIFTLIIYIKSTSKKNSPIEHQKTTKMKYRDALRFLNKNPEIFYLTLIALVINFAVANMYPIMILAFEKTYELSTSWISMVVLVINALTLFTTPVMKYINKKSSLKYYCLIVSLVGSILLFTENIMLYIVGCALQNIGIIIYNSYSTSVRQLNIPDNLKSLVVIVHKSIISIPYFILPFFLPKLMDKSLLLTYGYISCGLTLASFLLLRFKNNKSLSTEHPSAEPTAQ